MKRVLKEKNCIICIVIVEIGLTLPNYQYAHGLLITYTTLLKKLANKIYINWILLTDALKAMVKDH